MEQTTTCSILSIISTVSSQKVHANINDKKEEN